MLWTFWYSWLWTGLCVLWWCFASGIMGIACVLHLLVWECPPPHGPLATFVCPNRIKAFKLLYLVKQYRFSFHMHTSSSLALAEAFVLPFSCKSWASGWLWWYHHESGCRKVCALVLLILQNGEYPSKAWQMRKIKLPDISWAIRSLKAWTKPTLSKWEPVDFIKCFRSDLSLAE